jgi:O-antigen/teichoic acid export membrane protein
MTEVAPSAQAPKPRLAVQAIWLLFARTIGFIVAMAMPLVVARVLDKQEFGTYRLALVAATTASTMLPFSVGLSAFYFLPRLSEERRRALICHIMAYHATVGLGVMALLIAFPQTLSFIVGNDALTPLAPLVGATIATIILSAFFDVAATANQDVGHSTSFIILAQVSRAIMIIGSAVLFRTVEALLYAWIIQGLLQSAALLIYLNYRFPRFWKYRSRELAWEQLRYVVPFGIAGLIVVAQLDLHNYIVSHHFDAATYAIYAIGTAQVPFTAILRDSVNAVLQARMSKLQQDNEIETMLHLVTRAWRTIALGIIPLFASLMLLAPDFITALYEPRYIDSVPIFRLNLFVLLTNVFMTDAVMRAFDSTRAWTVKLRASILAVQVALSLFLVPRFGLLGALLALLLSLVIDRIISVAQVFSLLGFRRDHHMKVFRDFLQLAALSGIACLPPAAVLALLPHARPLLRLGVGMAIFGLSYMALVVVTGFLDGEERLLLRSSIARGLRMVSPTLAARVSS